MRTWQGTVAGIVFSFQSAYGQEASAQLKKIVSLQQSQIASQSREISQLKTALAQVQEQLKLRSRVVVYNSVGNPQGTSAVGDSNTLGFWNIAYADRLREKGLNSPNTNFYNPQAYLDKPATYVDEIEDINGKVAVVLIAEADGFDSTAMTFRNPRFVTGSHDIYVNQFGSGWSSGDHDGDPWGSNCAANYGNVTQHYGVCWIYNLGADAEPPADLVDNACGPHLNAGIASSLGFASDGSTYTRVRRITRYVQWK